MERQSLEANATAITDLNVRRSQPFGTDLSETAAAYEEIQTLQARAEARELAGTRLVNPQNGGGAASHSDVAPFTCCSIAGTRRVSLTVSNRSLAAPRVTLLPLAPALHAKPD